jgi:hypothetical protein
MRKSRFDKVYQGKIENKEYPFAQVADELVEILLEESLDPKYTNYKGDFKRSITLRELKGRLEKRNVEMPHPIELSRTVQAFLNKYKLKYEPKRRGHNGAVYSQITYSREKLDLMIKDMIRIMGDYSTLYEKQYLHS